METDKQTRVPFWMDLTKTIFLLMIWTTLGCDTLVPEQRSHCQTDTLHKPFHSTRCHQRAWRRIGHLRVCLLQRHMIKARRKSFQQLITGAGLEGHWLFLFTCFLVLHVLSAKKSVFSPEWVQPYYTWLPHFNMQQHNANRLQWKSDITTKPSRGDGTQTIHMANMQLTL